MTESTELPKLINELKKILSSIKNDNDKKHLLNEIFGAQEVAEATIRKHRRDVDFETKEYTIELTVQKYTEGLEDNENELFVPDYQRDFIWPVKKQSKLIESLLIGLPIPYIFTADIKDEDPELDGRTEIVDGTQRIRTLHAFLKGNLILSGLQLLKELNGFCFEDLPKSRQRRFNRIPLRIIELSENCNEETRRELFERINTGSEGLKDMEVRKGSKHGTGRFYLEVIKKCAQNPKFLLLAPVSEAKAGRGEYEELTLRFFAYFENYKNFDHSVRGFLDNYLESKKDIEQKEINRLVTIFNILIAFVEDTFPDGFKKTKTSTITPRVRFEALSVGVSLALSENSNLSYLGDFSWLNSPEFKQLTTSDGSNSRKKIIERIEYVKDQFLEG